MGNLYFMFSSKTIEICQSQHAYDFLNFTKDFREFKESRHLFLLIASLQYRLVTTTYTCDLSENSLVWLV